MNGTLEAENVDATDEGYVVPNLTFEDECSSKCTAKPQHVAYNPVLGIHLTYCTHHALKYEDNMRVKGFKFKPELPTDITKIII